MIITIVFLVINLLSAGILYLYRWNLFNPLHKATLQIDHLERTFFFHVPKQISSHSKLILVYHGSKLPAKLMQIFTGHEFDEQADKLGNAIIVYPQGYKNNWNDCRKNTPYPARQLNLDDIGFTEQIIAYFIEHYHIASQEVYAVGFSNGGAMVMKLAKQKPQWFKGFAIIGANLPVETNDTCTDLRQPVSLLMISGEKDPISPYNGGDIILDGQSLGEVMSVEETLQHWLTVSKCQNKAETMTYYPNKQSGKPATASKADFYSDSTRKQISFIRIMNGGHTISNRNFQIPIKKMGYQNNDVDAPLLIWDFFMNLK
jgi:polyhydroxybutyrate depolymerase